MPTTLASRAVTCDWQSNAPNEGWLGATKYLFFVQGGDTHKIDFKRSQKGFMSNDFLFFSIYKTVQG